MKKLLLVLILAALPFAAQAGEKKEQGSGPNPYTECGIGAAIFKDLYWAAATSNVIWDLGSTALTSAISSPEMCNPKKIKTASLILETLPELEKDVAMGENGEFVTALADTMGCSSAKKNVALDLRQSYGAIVSKASYSEKTKIERATDMYNAARNAAKASGCGIDL